MGRKNKSYSKTLHQQAYDRLVGMQAFGESKKIAASAGTSQDKIFSFNTYKTYWKHTKYFIKWIQENHPECTTLKSARKYTNEWLQERTKQGLSAWTIQTEAKALGKLYRITPESPDYFEPPKRNRVNIKRSRGDAARDRHFSEANNAELIKFCKGTGLRRSELEVLRGSDLLTKQQIASEVERLQTKDNITSEESKLLGVLKDAQRFDAEYFMHVRSGKGGRERISPVIGSDVSQIVERMKSTGANEKVWLHVNSNADIHGYRAVYATQIYKANARVIEDIPFDKVNKGTGRPYQSEVYTCRKDEAGKKLDKRAMLLCSKALGHNRLEVVANNYIRGL
jgi:integrase